MGNCFEPKSSPSASDNLSPTEQKAHQGISTGLIDAASNDRKCKKLLLLGAGSSGKSTLFKQLKCIHGWGFENGDFNESRHNIRTNIVLTIIKLLHQSEKLYNKDIITKTVNLENVEIFESIKCIASFKDESFEFCHDSEFNWNEMIKLGDSIHLIWNLEAIQMTYNQRGRFAIPDNMDYFMNKVYHQCIYIVLYVHNI